MSATTAFAIDCVSGALSGMAAVAVGHPFDTLRTQVQVHAGEASPWKLAANLVKHEGVAGLFRGILPPLFAVGLGA
jgi:solute carrier family 25 (mitochondrial carnitine/acylcarnitine transporter), member 20/29